MRSHKYCAYNLQIVFREHSLIISTRDLRMRQQSIFDCYPSLQSWMAFEKIHRPLFAESKHVDFPNNNSVSTSYNGAFCKVRSTLLLSRRRLCNYLDGTAEKNRYISTPPGGGTPLYKLYKYVPLDRVGFLRRFGLTTGIHFAHFGLE